MQLPQSPDGAAAPLSLELHRTYPAAPERIFRAWVTPTELVRWWKGPTGEPFRVIAMDPRPGGAYEFEVLTCTGSRTVGGTYLEVSPPRRLVFTWLWNGHPETKRTTVTIELSARADGGTDLVLRHVGFPDQNMVNQHTQGWSAMLRFLAAKLEKD